MTAPIKTRAALVAVCNGLFFGGGGMMVAPDADLADRQFDVVVVRRRGSSD